MSNYILKVDFYDTRELFHRKQGRTTSFSFPN